MKRSLFQQFTSRVLLIFVLILISACASHTGVVSIGRDTYMIAKQQATGFPGLGNMKAEIIVEGSQHCATMKKEFHLVSEREAQPPYIFGNYPRSEISFMCLDADDPQLRRPVLHKPVHTAIEVRAR